MNLRGPCLHLSCLLAVAMLAMSPADAQKSAVAYPNDPVLESPEDQFVVLAQDSIPAVTFTWSAASSGISPDHYELTFKDLKDPTRFVVAPIYIPHKSIRTSTTQSLPTSLRGKRIVWSVKACARLANLGGTKAINSCSSGVDRGLTWNNSLTPPNLVSPAHGAGAAVRQQFRWAQAKGAASYLLCISKPGISCPTQETNNANTLVVRSTGRVNTHLSVDLIRFAGQNMNWTVAACTHQGGCLYQRQDRSLTWAPPQLISPAAGSTSATRARFGWNTVDWAEFYLVCISAPGVTCPTEPGVFNSANPLGSDPEETSLLRQLYTSGPRLFYPQLMVSNSQTLVFRSVRDWVYADLTPPNAVRPLDGKYNWTVAACRDAGYSDWVCKYQKNVRPITVRPGWRVEVKLEKIVVHDDCDNASAGDWKLMFVLLLNDAVFRGNLDEGFRLDPDSGSTYATGQKRTLDAVGDTDVVTIGLAAMDCDSDGIWTLANVFKGVGGFIDTAVSWTQQCSGVSDSAFEWGGSHDFAGYAVTTIRPGDYKNTGRMVRTIEVDSPGGYQCGNKPFTAHFHVDAIRN